MEKRKINSALTFSMLLEWGIWGVQWIEETGEWKITRYWYKNKSRRKHIQYLRISKAVCKHKYTKDKEYPVVVFSYKNKSKCIPLSRLIYVWHKGDIPEGMEVDHIDNNQFNNHIDNLQLLTPEENRAKRFADHPDCKAFNQYKNTLNH